jgi:amidase/aspartyl-tRNA(Asn)/glutamyl-tRNA(Gln) amidotransferase subunit A
VVEKDPRGVYLDFADLGQTAGEIVARALRTAAGTYSNTNDNAARQALAQALTGAAEAYSILQSTEAYGIHAQWLDTHRPHYGAEVWARLDRGRRWTPAQLEAARDRWEKIRAAWENYFAAYDFLVMPATPFPALTFADCTLENRNRLLALTAPASLGGLSVLTIPVTLPDGLSSGLQIVARTPQSAAISWALKRSASC